MVDLYHTDVEKLTDLPKKGKKNKPLLDWDLAEIY